MSKKDKCKKSSGKRMTAAQKAANKLAEIMSSSHWFIVTKWEGFTPFAQSELDNELFWARQQMAAFHKAKSEAKAKAKAEAKDKSVSQLRKELALQQKMLKEEKQIFSRQTTDEGRAARGRNVEILSQRCQEIREEIQSLQIRGWTEWTPVPVKPLGFTVAKSKPKPKLKSVSQVKPKPVTKAEMKARKSREVRLQRVEAAARKAAHEAAERQLEAAVRKELNKILAERRAKAEAERKAAAAAEKARLEAARKAAAAKKAEAERKAQRARERAEERKLFTSVYNATLRTALSRMVREEVARQLAAA